MTTEPLGPEDKEGVCWETWPMPSVLPGHKGCNDFHIIREDVRDEHHPLPTCWCQPRIAYEPPFGHMMVTHRAFRT